MLIPHITILITFLIGVISRVTLTKFAKRSKLRNVAYYYLSYRLFIITWEIMCIPIFANIATMIEHSDHFSMISGTLASVYIYFSCILIFFYSYMTYFLVNPQIGESFEKWSEYIKTPHFKLFEGFHLNIDARDWKKRNFNFVVSIIRLIIVIFVTFKFVNVPNLLLQIAYLVYLFTLRPFKLVFFNYFVIGIQICVITLYLFRYVTELYIGISN